MLQIGRQFLIVHTIVSRGLHFTNGVAPQRERPGYSQPPAGALDGVHQIPGLVVDFKNRALQQRPGRQAVGGIVVGRFLRNLNLRGDGRVFPLHQRGFPGGDIHGFHLRIGDIALIFQLPQIIAARNRQIFDIYIAGVVAGVLPDWGVGAVIQQKTYPIDTLAGHTVGFVNQYPAERLVCDGQRSSPAVLDGEIIRGAVQLEALRRLDFHSVVVPGIQIQVGAALFVGGDGVHQSAVHLPDLKGGSGDALGLVALGDLDKLQPALCLIEERKGLCLTLLDENGLGRRIQHKTASGLDFFGRDGSAGGQVGENNAPVSVGDIFAVVRSHDCAGAVSDEEGHALDGVGGAVHVFLNGQRLTGRVVDCDSLGIIRVDFYSLRAVLLLDVVAGNRLNFCDNHCTHNTGNLDLTVGIGYIDTVT